VSVRVARSRELVAQGRHAAAVARVAGSAARRSTGARPGDRRAIGGRSRTRRRRSSGSRARTRRRHPHSRGDGQPRPRPAGQSQAGAAADVRAHPLQRHRPLGRRRRPGFFRVERPDQLRHTAMTSVRVAEHERGHRLLHPRDLRLGARRPLPRPRGQRGPRPSGRGPGGLTGRADARHRQPAPPLPPARSARCWPIAHRRDGYRDPKSQAFMESWLSKFKDRGASAPGRRR
jgi:putative transposase